MRWIPLALVLALGATTVGTSPAAAQGGAEPESALAHIRELVFRARYDEAIDMAQQYLERDDLDAIQRNRGLEALATAYIANRDQERAFEVLDRLYQRDPRHRLEDPDASPLVQSAFARAREKRHEPVDVELLHDPPRVPRRESPLLEVRIDEGRDAVHELRVAYRTGDMSRYSRIVMNVDEGGVARSRLPVVGNAEQQQRVDYFIEALAPSLTPIARLGSAEEPLRLTIPPTHGASASAGTSGTTGTGGLSPTGPGPGEPDRDTDGGLAGEWWLWTIVGAVVIGGAVAGGLLLSGDGGTSGSLGSVSLN